MIRLIWHFLDSNVNIEVALLLLIESVAWDKNGDLLLLLLSAIAAIMTSVVIVVIVRSTAIRSSVVSDRVNYL